MKKFVPALILIGGHLVFDAQAQQGNPQMGARPLAMGNTEVVTDDSWGMFNNPGTLSQNNSNTLLFGYNMFYGLEGFGTVAAGYHQNIGSGVAGVGFYRFGDDLFNETIVSGVFSNRFGIAGLGARINYIQYQIQDFGSGGTVTLDFGGFTEVTPKVFVGASITNITQSYLSKLEDQRLPTTMEAGISLRPSAEVIVNFVASQILGYEAVYRAGLEYLIIDGLALRSGFQVDPQKLYFGLGLNLEKFTIDITTYNNPYLGFANQLSVTYTP